MCAAAAAMESAGMGILKGPEQLPPESRATRHDVELTDSAFQAVAGLITRC